MAMDGVQNGPLKRLFPTRTAGKRPYNGFGPRLRKWGTGSVIAFIGCQAEVSHPPETAAHTQQMNPFAPHSEAQATTQAQPTASGGAAWHPRDFSASWTGLTAVLLLWMFGGMAGAAPLRAHERWIWTELIGFDNQQPDLGVAQYLDTAGFVPTAVCLLIGSPDFVLSHRGIEKEAELAPEYCSREGHEFNQERKRQVWTNHQLRALVRGLRGRGVQVYLSLFATYTRDKSHREWISDHREVLHVRKSSGFAWALNCLSRLNDGSYFEDYFATQMVRTLRDYEFDGWHGADGWGPLSGPLHEVSFSDDMIDQFAATPGMKLPEVVTRRCVFDVPKLTARADWILKHKRAEWSEFYAERWARFWKTIVTALHGAEKKAVVNSAWGRAPFESLYRYGIDYQRIAATGVDGIIVETVAAGLAMDPRLANEDRHDDFLSMLMLLRACVPDTRLIFLHNAHDVVEQWDALRHIPTVLEREIYSLANVFHTKPDGTLRPSADGFLLCLGDGLKRDEWRWLEERWTLAFSPLPQRVLGATVVWSDAAFRAQMDDYLKTRAWDTHRLLSHLMADGAIVQSTIPVNAVAKARGALLVPNAHLLPPDELAAVMDYRGGPVMLIGRKTGALPKAEMEFSDVHPPYEFWCGVYGAKPVASAEISKDATEPPQDDVMSRADPRGYWDHLPYRKVSPGFIKTCAQTLLSISTTITADSANGAVALMPVESADGRIRLAIKNRTASYARPQIDIGRPVRSVEVRGSFPSVAIRPDGSKFSLRVPGRGITIVDVVPEAE